MNKQNQPDPDPQTTPEPEPEAGVTGDPTAGPLKFPMPPDLATRRALERLKGHTTAANWLLEGLWPELEDLRTEQLRLRGQVASEIEALNNLATKHTREDSEYAEALRQAQRDGSPTSAEDRRTPADDRAAERVAIEERLWAGLQVFAEHADRIIEAFRDHEDEWLTDLRSRLGPAQEKRREAQRLLAEARTQEWTIHRLGQWVQATSDDGPFGRQPAPKPEPVPERLSAETFKGALERPWHKQRDWSGTKTGSAS